MPRFPDEQDCHRAETRLIARFGSTGYRSARRDSRQAACSNMTTKAAITKLRRPTEHNYLRVARRLNTHSGVVQAKALFAY